MKISSLIAAFSFCSLTLSGAAHADEHVVRTHVSNGSNSASVIQSGDPQDAQVKIERRPGYTRIEQHSSGNSSTIIQSNGSGASDKQRVERMIRSLTSEQ